MSDEQDFDVGGGAAETVAPAEAPSESAESTGPSLDDALAEAYDKAQNAASDDDDGRQDSEDRKSEGDEQEPSTGKPAEPAISAPNTWSTEMKERFGTLPSDVQTYVLRREQEMHAKISDLGQTVSRFEPIGEVLESYREVFERHEADSVGGLQAMLEFQRWLDADPKSALSELARRYNVRDGFAQPDDADNFLTDPQVESLKQTVQKLESRLAGFENAAKSQAEREQKQRSMAMTAEVNAFSIDKPDFDDLQADIALLLPAIGQQHPAASPKELLELAYERARWSNPTTRQRLLDEQSKTLAAERQEKAKKASKAGRINVNGSASAMAAQSLDEALNAAYDRIQAN